jgi:flagellar biosynthesis/type III secretory pathway M-ring protein FliF/YscJ
METIRRTLKQYRDVYQSMAPSQRMPLIVVTAIVIGGFGFLMMRDSSGSYTALSWGKAFTYEELVNTEQSLIDGGLNDYRREGNRIMVPAADVDRYNAVLLEQGSLPDDYGSEMLNQLAQNGIFTSSDQSRTRKEAVLAKHLRRVIRQIPAINDAQVIWTSVKNRRLGRGGSKVTASVFVTPKHGSELSMQLVQVLRLGVAGAVSDLQPTDVVIIDQAKGQVYEAETNDAFNGKLLSRIQQFEKMYYDKIAPALSYIDGVLITVNVDLEKVKSSVRKLQKLGPKSFDTTTNVKKRDDTSSQQPDRGEPGTRPNQPRNLPTADGNLKRRTTSESVENLQSTPLEVTLTEEQLEGAMPEAVQVSVSIPDDYYRAVALKSGFTEGTTPAEKNTFQSAVETIKETVKTDVESVVMRNIPLNSAANFISVVSIIPIDPEIPETVRPMTETVVNVVSQWGGAVALGLFALWTLWMLDKSMVKLPEVHAEAIPGLSVHSPEQEIENKETVLEEMREASLREELQSVVRDSPELTASVLTKWIQDDQ